MMSNLPGCPVMHEAMLTFARLVPLGSLSLIDQSSA